MRSPSLCIIPECTGKHCHPPHTPGTLAVEVGPSCCKLLSLSRLYPVAWQAAVDQSMSELSSESDIRRQCQACLKTVCFPLPLVPDLCESEWSFYGGLCGQCSQAVRKMSQVPAALLVLFVPVNMHPVIFICQHVVECTHSRCNWQWPCTCLLLHWGKRVYNMWMLVTSYLFVQGEMSLQIVDACNAVPLCTRRKAFTNCVCLRNLIPLFTQGGKVLALSVMTVGLLWLIITYSSPTPV